MKVNIKAEIKVALNELGKTSTQIANTLKKKKITGKQKNSNSCPIAIYIIKKFPKASAVEVDSRSVDILIETGSDWEIVKVNKCIAKFINDFDSGHYPELIR